MARSAPSGSVIVASLVAALAATSARAGDVSVKLDSGAGFSVKDSTGAVERLRVDEATGNVSRNGALFVHTTGFRSLFVGEGAGNLGITGSGKNTALGFYALHSNTSGHGSTAVGRDALRSNTVGGQNSAFGALALYFNTTGGNNSAFGYAALTVNSTGVDNSGFGSSALQFNSIGAWNSAFGYAALRSNSTGNSNSAFGMNALWSNTTGIENSAFGRSALFSNTAGNYNATFGSRALLYNTTGTYNSAFGTKALRANTSGGLNTAVGFAALYSNTIGGFNSAFGNTALRNNTTGLRNVAVGRDAGYNQTTGSDNIYLANTGVAGESGQIKIGTVGTHTGTTIAGISGATSAGGVAVLVNASGVLGTTTSSARFKEDVRDMGEASDVLMKLRPVTFRYREDAVGAEDAKTTQYGLIAEEVAEVAPELVAPDLEGKPYSVKYHELPALLVNEAQRQQRADAEQQARIEAQTALLDAQRKQIAALTARLTRLEARD